MLSLSEILSLIWESSCEPSLTTNHRSPSHDHFQALRLKYLCSRDSEFVSRKISIAKFHKFVMHCWPAANTPCRSTAVLRFRGWTCSFSSSGSADRTSRWTWWHRRPASPRRRRTGTWWKSFWLNFAFAFVQLNELLLATFSHWFVWHGGVLDRARFTRCSEASASLLSALRSVFELLDFSLKRLIKLIKADDGIMSTLTGYLLGYSISTSCSSDKSSGGCLCGVAVHNATIQRLPANQNVGNRT